MTSVEPLILPLFASAIMPGEHIVLYLAQLLYYSQHSLTPRSWQWPSAMREIIEAIPELVGSLDYVKRYCTLLPAIARCLPEKSIHAIVGHFDNATQLGLQGFLGMNGPRAGWAMPMLARCPVCIKEDIAAGRLPLFRREHLLPGVLFCGRHEHTLHIPCERCRNFYKYPAYTRHANFHCGCGLAPIPAARALPDHVAELEIHMAKTVARLLDPSYLPNLNHEGIGRLIGARSQELGVVEGNFFRADTAIQMVNDSAFRPLIERTSIVVERSDSAARLFKGAKVPRSPIEVIALAGSMFPDWSEVERRATGVLPKVPKTPLVFRPAEVRAEARQHRVDWMARNHERWFRYYAEKYAVLHRKHPDKSHVQLMRLLPHGAGLYLTEKSLKAAGYSVPEFSVSIQYCKSLDKSLSLHIRARKREVERTNARYQATEGFLVEGHRMARGFKRADIYRNLTATRAALALCKESKEEFKQRIGRSQYVH